MGSRARRRAGRGGTGVAASSRRATQQVQHKANTDFAAAKQNAVRDYNDGKGTLESEFQEARWTIDTVYESDKKVARDQLVEAEASCKDAVEKLRTERDLAKRLCRRWTFVGPLRGSGEVKLEPAGVPDPFKAMQECLDRAQADLAVLQQLRPRLINGIRPWVALGVLLAARVRLPCVLFSCC